MTKPLHISVIDVNSYLELLHLLRRVILAAEHLAVLVHVSIRQHTSAYVSALCHNSVTADVVVCLACHGVAGAREAEGKRVRRPHRHGARERLEVGEEVFEEHLH